MERAELGLIKLEFVGDKAQDLLFCRNEQKYKNMHPIDVIQTRLYYFTI